MSAPVESTLITSGSLDENSTKSAARSDSRNRLLKLYVNLLVLGAVDVVANDALR